jgi:glyoxylase I family protein
MIRGIHHVAIHVRSLDRMIQFYRDAFGFEVQGAPFEWSNNEKLDQILDVPGSAARQAIMRAGNCYVELFEFSAPAPESDRPLRASDKGYTHFCVDVTDIEKEYERLKSLGMSFSHFEPIDMGIVKTVYGRDPEGNIIEIQQTEAHCNVKLEEIGRAHV